MQKGEMLALRISELVLKHILADRRIQIHQSESAARKRVEQKIHENFNQEKELLDEIYHMMEKLEKEGHAFERQKMFPLLKKQLAKKKGFIL